VTTGRLLPLFSLAFALCYGYAASVHLEIFIYYPAIDDWTRATKPLAEAGPPMLWYGWIAFGSVGGLLAMLAGLGLPRRLERSVWPALSWMSAFGVALVQIWLARAWFLQ